jgi:uncharacterized damage-inducible protein DinB
MVDTEFCVTMARYNEWMNRRLYASCATLSADELKRDRGAFFRSIHGTLNHIVYADLAFLSRFTGEPPQPPELGVDLYDDFSALREAREALDARILEWAAALAPEWLPASLTYTSKVDGKSRTVARWILVAHLFNHQTHHRGQVMTLLTQLGLDIGSTDLPFMPGLSG